MCDLGPAFNSGVCDLGPAFNSGVCDLGPAFNSGVCDLGPAFNSGVCDLGPATLNSVASGRFLRLEGKPCVQMRFLKNQSSKKKSVLMLIWVINT